jgi:CBS domain-containing protein
MRAAELAAPFPSVDLETPAIEAARLLAAQNLPGLIVVDEAGFPRTVLPGTEVLRLALPSYSLDDPALARAIDEATADTFLKRVGRATVAECLPRERRELPVVDPKATLLEVAVVMARCRSPLVAVAEKGQQMLGAITLDSLLDRMLHA